MDSMIAVNDYVKRYGKFTAVDHVSFAVERGSVFAFHLCRGREKMTLPPDVLIAEQLKKKLNLQEDMGII